MNDAASFNPFADALAQFDRLADLMGLDQPTRALLRYPAHEHRLTLPVRLDDGTVEVVVGRQGLGSLTEAAERLLGS